jgi:HK97 gp10 family phage protein
LIPGFEAGKKVLPGLIAQALGSVKSLKQLPRALDKALRQSIGVAQNTAKRLAPVDTGRLRGSLNVANGSIKKAGELHYTLGTNVVYARFVEFGTRPHASRKAKSVQFSVRT